MKIIYCFILVICTVFNSSASELKLSGKIGDYPIEMVFSSTNWTTGKISGKYRYQSKTKYIELNGQIFGNCLQLTETVKGEVTGEFYLEREADTLYGKWLSTKRHYDVRLLIESGDRTILKSKSLSDYKSEVTDRINGTYHNAHYFLNDMFLTDQNIEMEIGFNGGLAVIEKISNDSIYFQVNVGCGPTYHIAFAEGIAVKNKGSEKYTFKIENEYSEDLCTITIVFGKKEVSFEATEGFACGFGARAYLSHTFLKTSEAFEFDEEF